MWRGVLTCWVEGTLDYQFLQLALRRCAVPAQPQPRFWNHESDAAVNAFWEQCRLQEEPALFLADSDAAAVAVRRRQLLSRYPALDPDALLIVHGEIEAWVLSGVPLHQLDAFGPFEDNQRNQLSALLTTRGGTDGLRQRAVEALIPVMHRASQKALKRWYRRVLVAYDWDQAIRCNTSLGEALQTINRVCSKIWP